MNFKKKLESLIEGDFQMDSNLIFLSKESDKSNQDQTIKAFDYKWESIKEDEKVETSYEFQKKWYLSLYGFKNEDDLKTYLNKQDVILDAGCGLGYKAAWFAELAPNALVIGVDYSTSVKFASEKYKTFENLFFMQGDIADLPFKNNSINYVNCDQVIMHTENPDYTFSELTRILKINHEFACYVYSKKALPRELLDDYFRIHCKDLSHDELYEMSEQLTELGKRLSEIEASIDVPDIPALGIKGGKYDVQRFIYWNFIKCFWNEELGREISDATNFDWYSPSNAKRYSESEYRSLITTNALKINYFHSEEACYSGRFMKEELDENN